MRRLRAAAKLAGILLAFLAPPVVLVAVAGNPLPSWPIDWGLVGDSLLTRAVATSTWLQLVAAAAWLVWAVLVSAVFVDLVATLQGRRSRVRFAPVRSMVVTIVTLAGQLSGSAAWATPTASPAASVPVAMASYDSAVPPGTSVPIGMRLVEVEEGDSWAGFAETAVGNAAAAGQLREANAGREVGGTVLTGREAFVEAGWQLLVPDERGEEAAEVVPATAETTPPASPTDERWEVTSGDHFWSIAASTLEEAHGRAPTDAEIAVYWQELVDANLDRLDPPGDPDLIYPGQQLVVPPVERTSADETAELPVDDWAASAPEAVGDEVSPPTIPEASQEQDGDPDDDVDPRAQVDRSVGGWQAAIDPPAGTDRSTTPSAADAAFDDTEQTAWGTPAGLAGGVAAAGLLAAGVTAVLRRRRRAALEQRPPGLRLPTLAPEVVEEVGRLEAAAPPEQTLDNLAALLGCIPAGTSTPLVTVTDDGVVTLLFADGTEVPEPPLPWRLADLAAEGPVGWSAHLGDRGPTRSVGLPLLATAGRTAETTVLVDLGAMRSLTVTGEEKHVRQRLRAITMEVATSRVAGPLEVVVAGDQLLDGFDQVWLVDRHAEGIAAAVAERDEGVVAEDRVPRLLVCHDGVPAPHVPDGTEGLVAVVAAGDVREQGWVLDVASHQSGQLRLPDGGRVEVILPEVDPSLVDAELHRTASDSAAPLNEGSVADQALVSMPPTDRLPFVEVRLLGQVEIAREGRLMEGLTPKTTEVIAFLATHRDGVTRDQLEDAVWAGQPAAQGSQRVKAALSKARDALGDGPDGELLVPRRQSSASRLQLSDHVGTDLDRAFAHLAAARQQPETVRLREITAALELVRGEPFAGMPVSWSTEVQQRAIAELQDAAVTAAIHYRERGEWEAAKSAIERGLALCDPAEPLYLEWARLEVARGRRDQVHRIWQQLRDRYADEADEVAAWVVTPTAETELQFQELLAGASV